jgi:trans-2,3-dihydro-3-hydroxyanthranilate isomerase
LKLWIVDVFAERPCEGNQLAVVESGSALDTAAMQRIAREMNFSETTFVTTVDETGADVRIFTPHEELPFAGHPTLGTAWVLGRDVGRSRLRLLAGNVDVELDGNMAWMEPPLPDLREPIPADVAARLIGAVPDADWPARRVHSGAEYCLVPVPSLAALRSIRPDLDAVRKLSPGGALFTVCREAYSDDADFAVRMHFFDGIGMREDPATGSANSAFAAYLRELGSLGDFVVEQGFEIGRPSRLYLGIGATLRVGGRVQLIVEGQLVSNAKGGK